LPHSISIFCAATRSETATAACRGFCCCSRPIIPGWKPAATSHLERLIEHNKERYYETLEQGSIGWHDSRHDPRPCISHVLSILKTAYEEFEARVGQVAESTGAKAELMRDAVRKQRGSFRVREIQRACPGVGHDWIRTVLAEMKRAGEVQCMGRGPAARWRAIPAH
jgi:hypothetical protein